MLDKGGRSKGEPKVEMEEAMEAEMEVKRWRGIRGPTQYDQ